MSAAQDIRKSNPDVEISSSEDIAKAKRKKQRDPIKVVLIVLAIVYVAILLVLPLIYVLVQALGQGFSAFAAAITEPYALSAIRLTLLAGLVSVLINTIFGLFAAWCITKFKFHGRRVLMTLIDLPMAVSPVIVGLIYILTYGRTSPIYGVEQALGVQIIFAVPAIILVTVFVTFPFVSRELIPVMLGQGTDEEEAASLMGAKFFTIFRRVTLPHIKWALLYGIVLCAARALGEFGAVSVVSGNLRGITLTMPLYIETLYNEYQYSAAFAVSSLLVVFAIIILFIRSYIEYRGGKDEENNRDADMTTSRRGRRKKNRQEPQTAADEDEGPSPGPQPWTPTGSATAQTATAKE